MKKPTILRTLIFVLALMLNFASYSQNLIAYNSTFQKNLNQENIFLKSTNQLQNDVSLDTIADSNTDKLAAPTIPSPLLKYAMAPYAGTISNCPNDGEKLPKFFICGTNDARLLDSGITNTTQIFWERLTGGCTSVPNANCANTLKSCTWANVATGQTYSAGTAGQFRLRVINPDTTESIFYFNVYTNDLDPTGITKANILTSGGCTIPGNITINGFNSLYQYSITPNSTTTPVTWQNSNVFPITTARKYNVYMRLKGVTGTCVFNVKNIEIESIAFNASIVVTHPKCFGEKGSIRVNTGDLGFDYRFELWKGGVFQTASPNIKTPEYNFTNVDPGNNYEVRSFVVSNCLSNTDQNIVVNNPNAQITAVPSITSPTACTSGNIKVTTAGGTGTGTYQYYYKIDTGAEVYNAYNDVIVVTAPGTYTIRVVDANQCTVTATTTITTLAKPNYTVSTVNPNCNSTTGSIVINVINDNGYTLNYSKDNFTTAAQTGQTGYTYGSLTPGNYTIKVRYRVGSRGTWCEDTHNLLINTPASPVTASGGVAKLSGCGDKALGQEDYGLLRITNPQGGTAPYEYKFGASGTYGPIREKFMPPGTYTLYIRDANGCEYSMPNIILQERPAAPRIDKVTTVYNCDGSAVATATVINPTNANYSYEYYLDGVLNTNVPANVFVNVPYGTNNGRHDITVKYNLLDAATYSNLLSEDFGKGGPTTSPGINPAYCFETQTGTHAPGYACNTDDNINDGEYAVTNRIVYRFGSWLDVRDHTSSVAPATQDPQGRFLAINIGGSAGEGGIIYRKPIYDVIPNQDVKISFWVENLINKHPDYATNDDPNITIELIADYGLPTQQRVAYQATGIIPKTNKWENYNMSLNPGNYTTLDFVVRSYSIEFFGNDLALDDIKVFQIPESCLSTAALPFFMDANKAFTGSVTGISNIVCSGDNTGSFQIIAENFNTTNGFEYTIDGTTWFNSKVSPVNVPADVPIPGLILTPKTYDVRVRYSPTDTSCNKLIPTTITSPTAFVVDASASVAICGGVGATVTATLTGGSTPYLNLILTNVGTGVVRAFPTSAPYVLTGVLKGTYKVSAEDNHGCDDARDTDLIIDYPTPPTIQVDATTGLCYDGNNATIKVDISGGTAPYRYQVDFNGLGFGSISAPFTATTFNYNATAPGTYTFRVLDNNSCYDQDISQKIDAKISATTAITKALSCKDPDATIKVDITDGTAPFKYRVKLGTTGTYGPLTNVVGTTFDYTVTTGPGLYIFEVTDFYGCPIETSATINAITNPTVTATPTNPKCFGDATGEVKLQGFGGSSGYQYNFNNLGWSTESNYTGLSAGIAYSYRVMDNNGCMSPTGQTITLTQPPVVGGSIALTSAIKCGTTSTVAAVVTVTGTGGVGGFTYSFNGNVAANFTGTNTLSTTTATTVNAYVKDANGCVAGPFTVSVVGLDPITGINLTDHGYDCSTTPAGGHVTIAAIKAGSLANIVYQITAGPAGYNTATNTTGDFKPLAPGNYTFTATDTATNCTASVTHTVVGTPSITAGGSVTTSIKCNGGTGNISFTVSGISASGYDYVVRNGSGTAVQQATAVPATTTTIAVTAAQPAGTYTITVTDRLTKCPATYAVILTQPVLPLSVTATAPSVNCNKYSVIIDADALGGTLSYEYTLVAQGSPVPTTGFTSNDKLTVNTVNGTQLNWVVYVKDANGCIASFPIAIAKEDGPLITSIDFNNQCTATSSSTFLITVNATGLATLTYSIDGTNFQTDKFFTVNPGTYTITVKDKNGCTISSTTPIVVYGKLTASTVVKELDCSATPNATITVNANGGRTPYKYEVYNGTAYVAMATNVYTTNTAGTYLIKVIDNNGCEFITSTVINAKTNPTVTFDKTDVSCNGGATGSVQLYGANGVPGYTYSDDNITFTNVSLFENLAAGPHTFYVKDSKQCIGSVPVTIGQPTPLDATATATDFSCSPTNTKQSAVVTIGVPTLPTAGTGPYEYSFNGSEYSSNNTLTVNDNGSDQIISYSVKDSKGCTSTVKTITIHKLDPPVIATIVSSPILCLPAASTTSTITVTATNGVGALAYEILSGPVVNTTGATSGQFTGLTPGTYSIKVTDTNGCYAIGSHTINNRSQIAVTASKLTDVDCFGNGNGSIRYEVSGFTTTYSYSVNGTAAIIGQTATTFTLPNLTGTTTYSVVFTDDFTKCTVPTSIIISQPTLLTLSLVSSVNANNCGKATSTVTVVAGGGTPAYQYAILDADDVATGTPVYGGSAIFNINSTGGTNPNWVIFVKDAKECVAQLPVTVVTDPLPTVTAIVANQCTATGNSFQIVATGANGVAPYTYTIDSGVAPSPANTFTVGAGTYIITVRDANNCPSTVTITVNQTLTATAILTKDITCAPSPESKIDVSVSGGKSPFGYRVKIGAGTYSGLPIPFAGTAFTYTPTSVIGTTYEFEISDANGTVCTALTNIITTNTPAIVTASAAKEDPTCNGFNDGSIEVSGTAGVSPFEYSLNGAPFVKTKVFGNLIAGLYNYRVKDAKGCISAPVDITLVDPVKIAANVVPVRIECNSNKPGSINVDITAGGVAPFTYTLYNNAYTQISTPIVTSSTSVTFGGNIADLTLLTFGDYYVTIVDANGCEFRSLRTRILTPPNITATGVSSSGTCAGGANATINVVTAVYPVTYSIYGQSATQVGPTAATSHTFTGLDHGTTYQFQVVDAGGCFTIVEVTTPPSPSAIAIDPVVKTNVSCNGGATGQITFTVRNYGAGVTRIDYEVRDELTNLPIVPAAGGSLTGLTGAAASDVITGLKAGNYTLYLKEFNGTRCNASQKFQILQPIQPLTSSILSVVNANCDNPAQVTLKTTGGTGPYTYAYAVDPAVPSAFTSTSNVLNLDPGIAGTDLIWNIIVKDANGCTFPLQVTIVKDLSPAIALQVVNKCVAEGAFVIRVTGTTGTGAHSISVDNDAAYTSFTGLPYLVTGLSSGSHTIYVKDANGCIDSETIIIDKPLGLNPVVTGLPTCANNDGVVTVTPSGGSGTFTYTIAPMPASATITGNIISGLPKGTYTVTIIDTNTLCDVSATVVLSAPTLVTFDAEVIAASCFGSTDGSITVNLLPGNNNPVYTYAITPTPVGMVQVDNKFTNLPSGPYTITVSSGRGCDFALPFTVGQPAVLDADATVKDFACNIASNVPESAVVTVVADPTTGTAPYQYNFDGTSVYHDANTLTVIDNNSGLPQTIHYYVIDAHGCKFDDTVDVPPFFKITGLTFSAPPITCINTTTTVTVAATGGSTITNYAIIAPASAITNTSGATTGIFTLLAPGTYTFEVTNDKDCKYQNSYTVKPVTNITVSGQLIKNVSCNETPSTLNGSVAFTVANFTGAYTYTITPAPLPANVTVVNNVGFDVITVTGLGVNSYKIDINDTVTGCVATTTVAVSQPAIPLTITLDSNTPANCNFGAIVTVSGHDGTPGYLYAFVDTNVTPVPAAAAYKAVSTKVLDANPTKNWVAFVKDANGCIAQVPLPLTTDPLPTIDPITGVCYTGAPVAVTLVGHGVGTLQYSIGNGYSTSPNFTLNAPGTYTFYVKDANNCVATTPYVYKLEQELLLNAALTDLTCNAPASVVLTATQGTGVYTGGYEYSTDGITFNPVTFSSGTTFTTSTPGTYIFKVEDSQACTAVTSKVVITPNVIPTFSYTQVNVSCDAGSNGSFTIIPGLGTAPFEYSVDGGAFVSTNIPHTGLVAATYSVVVRDVKLCLSAPQDIIITAPAALVVVPTIKPFTCSTSNVPTDAVLTLAPAGGTPSITGEYSYSFDNGANFGSSPSLTINTNANQTITYVVVDANGCRVSGIATIVAYTRPTDMNLTATPIYCNTAGGVASVTVNSVAGGVGPYKYEIISPVASAVVSPTGVFNNLLPETYQIQVTDYNGTGCSTVKSIIIEEEDKISVDAQLLSDVLCNGDNTGSVAFTIGDYITNPAPAGGIYYTYLLTPNVGTPTKVGDVVTYTGLTNGSYTFTVTDATSGCTASETNFLVNQPAAPLAFTTTQTNIDCIDKTAIITVNAVGGTPDYQYAAVVSTSPAPAATAYSNSKDLSVNTALDGLVWDVYVKDLKGCAPTFQTVIITEDPLPTGAVVNPFSQCPDPANGTYTFTISGVTGVGPFQYSIGSGFQTSPTFIVTAAGPYTLTVKDANNCEVQFPALIDIFPALNLQVNVTTLPNCTTNGGVIKATATGGATPANYEFSLDGNFPNTTGDFITVGSGNHHIIVTDLTTGCEDRVDFNIPAATRITDFALAHTEVSCNNASDGTITATIGASSPGVNDNPDYTYAITAGPITTGFTPINIFTGLPPGDYTVTVRSARGCEELEDVRIIQPLPIVVNAPVVTEFGCTAGTNGTNSATITVNSVTGGSLNYINYRFFRGTTLVQEGTSNVYTETNTAGGSYSVTVYDDKGCSGTSTGIIRIGSFISLDDISVKVDNAITCLTNENITVTAVTIGGTPTSLLYSLEGTAGTVYSVLNQPTGVFTGLAIGTYVVTITNPATNCSIQRIHYVFDPNTFSIVAAPVKVEICYGTADGAVDLTFVDDLLIPSNEAGIFDYTITGPVPSAGRTTSAGPVRISNLIAGQYDVVATLVNSPGCTVTTSFSIEQPTTELLLDTTISNITCKSGNDDGAISAFATGGWDEIYEYQLIKDGAILQDYSTLSDFSNLTFGNYIVNARDGRGCIATANIVLANPTPIIVSATPSATALLCFGDKNATITVAPPTGGQGSGYLYTLNIVSGTPVIVSGPQSSPIFTGLGAGTYTVTVTDGFNCEATSATITITEPTIVQPNLVMATGITCFTNATLTLSATGGTGPYTYSEDGITYSASFNSSVTFPVAVGLHRYYVRDFYGCTSFISNDVNVEPVTPLAIELDVRNAHVNCTGDNSAVVVANATGGLGNYEYSLLDNLGQTIRPAQPDGIFANLTAGNYTIHVRSVDCETDQPFTVTESPNPLITSYEVFPVKCFGDKNGSIVVTAAGGTGVIKYAISPYLDQYVDSGTFTGLEAGTYTVVVQDILGCLGGSPYTIVVDQPGALIASEIIAARVPELCKGDKDGQFSIQVSGGTPSYSVSLDDEKGVYTPGAVGQTRFDFIKQSGGTHSVYIKDANGCISEVEIDLPEPVTLEPTVEINYDCVNNAAANSVTVIIDDSNTDPSLIKYEIDGLAATNQASNIFLNVAPGIHYVTAIHDNGCFQSSTNFTIKTVDPLAIGLSAGAPEMNVISVTATGGSPAYEYSFNGEAFTSSNTYKIYKSGDYVVVVRDQNGCTATIIVPMIYVDVCIPDHFTPNGDGQFDEWGPECTNIYNNLLFDIYDRYGRVVAKYHYGQKWDGKYNGAELPTGDYWYVLKLNDEKDAREFVGHFTLYR